MIKTGKLLNRKIDCVISSMEQPLGYNVGNSLEVIESIDFLKGYCAQDLKEITLELGAKTLMNCKIAPNKKLAYEMIENVIKNGQALEKFTQIIIAQGGDDRVINDYSLFNVGKNKVEIKALKSGFISKLKAIDVAHCAKLLGAGRDKKSDSIDYGAGIILKKKVADFAKTGDTIMELYFNNVEKSKLDDAVKIAQNSFILTDSKPANLKLIYKD